MSRLVWGETGTRIFETGVDRGVLFPPNGADGVPWNGLTAVNEAPNGADLQPFYQDGVKYLQVASAEEYKASIQAFSAPPEFDLCDGIANIHPGLFISQQPRKQFGFSYRTLIGNDIRAESFGYKLHLVYNALSRPASRERSSIGSSTEPMNLSWDIETVPPPISGFKPSAHLVISSLTAAPFHLAAVENIVYGQDGGASPRQPTIADLLEIFGTPVPEPDTIWIDLEDGIFSGAGEFIIDHGDGTFTAEVNTDHGDGTYTTE